MISKQNLFSIPFVSDSEKNFISHIKELVRNEKKCFIVTANPEIVMKTKEDETFKKIVLSADFVTPDGIGVVKSASLLGKPVNERITGFDTMTKLLAFANTEQKSVYFLGAAEDVIVKAVQTVTDTYPNIKIAGYRNGFFKVTDEVEIINDIKEAAPDLVFIALGSPKQEQFIAKLLPEMSKGLFMGVGGSFDVLSGTVKRAPDWVIAANIEWLYRISSSPTRLKRSLVPLIRFSFLTLKELRKK